VARENERLNNELTIAREVQAQLYPRKLPDCDSLQLLPHFEPARLVSGDFYDYHNIGPSRVCFAIGDVAGKGISAALLMATVQSNFRSQITDLQQQPDCQLCTSDMVVRLNKHLCANSSPEKFATFFLGLYDEASGVLTYTNAGHLPPILIRRGAASRLDVDGMVIGAFPFAPYGQSTVQLEAGDLLVGFTDGISEPHNEYGEMYGEERLVELVQQNAHRTSAQLVSAIMDDVLRWTGSPELQDDMTLLLIRRT
jgi:phosphoserine phosphatase RsbU/P